MKRVLSLILALATVVSMLTFVASAADTQATVLTPGEAKRIPNTETDANQITQDGYRIWEGDVPFDTPSKAVTFVFRVTGVDSKIVATKVNPFFTLADNSSWDWATANPYEWSNTWCGGALFLPEMPIEENGTYYLYLNQKALTDDKNSNFAIQSVKALNIFSKQGSNKREAPVNLNDNATFEMLAIVPNDLKATVNFYDEDQKQLLTTQSVEYTNVGDQSAKETNNNDKQDGINNRWAKQFDKLVDPTDLFLQQTEVELPDKTKEVDGKLCRLVWKDAEGNTVDGVYQSGDLYAGYEEVDTSMVDVTFVDVDGKKIYSKTLNKKELGYVGENPTKDADEKNTYTFAGWSVEEGGEVINLSTYQVPDDVIEITFYPVFKEDLILKASLSDPDDIPMGGTKTFNVVLNRDNLTVDVLTGTTVPINSGFVYVSYPADALKADGQSIAGATATAAVKVSSVTAEGVVGQIELTALPGFAGTVTASLSGYVSNVGNVGNVGKAVASTSQKLSVTGQLPGLYLSNPTSVTIAKADENTTPAKQTLWSGSVPFDDADAVTFIYKMEGVKTPINAYQLSIGYNGDDTSHGQQKNWNADTWGDSPSPRYHTFKGEDGCYALYINKCLVDDDPFVNVSNLSIFSTSTTNPENNTKDNPENTNENATITVLAVIGAAPAATVTFHDNNDEVIEQPYTHTYIDESKFSKSNGAYNKGSEMKQTVKLLSAAEIFTKSGYTAPTKDADECYKYTYAGWADKEGNRIDAVYMNMDVYPYYDKTPIDPVTVHFMNGSASVANADYPRAGYIEYTGANPTKADEGDHSYLFRGWTTDSSKTLAASEAQAKEYCIDLTVKTVKDLAPTDTELTLYAVFEQTARMWNIRFLGEDGSELGTLRALGNQLVNANGETVTAPQTPAKDADDKYTYEPNGWADKNGTQIVDKDGKLMAAVTADTDVYPAYTKIANKFKVVFLNDDKWTELGVSYVDYGGTAAAPAEPTKAATEYFTYAFAGWVDQDGKPANLSGITGDCTFYASYKATFNCPFTDVSESGFYYDALAYALENGIMNGTDATHFSPGSTATRGQLVTVLYRMENEPAVDDVENPFSDLGSESAYYYKAVLWAYSRGLVSGVTETEFKPTSQITREQFATILYRYAKEIKGYYVGYGDASYDSYPDKGDVHSYASDAFRWAIATAKDLQSPSVDSSLRYDKEAYITGVARSDGNYLAPANPTTRAQMATMLYRFLTGDHVMAPVQQDKPQDMTGLMTVDPSVYAVGDSYQICVLVSKETTMWVEVNGKNYYDHSNGILRSDKFIHIVTVPMSELDLVKGYTVYLREIIERKPYNTVCGGIETKQYNFRPIEERDSYNIINLADSHSKVDAAIGSGSYFGDNLDLLVMNGDIIDNSGSIDYFKYIYRISGHISKGEAPCIYSRGNHELRGVYAGLLADYVPTDNGKSYYTFRLGPIWGIVMDAGEDKTDSNPEYGNTVAFESAFREEESKFLDQVIASREWEGASIKLVISHVPFVIKMSAPYNIEQERYADWCKKLASIEPTLWMTGHLHQTWFELPGERNNTWGYPCPVLCSSGGESNSHYSGAVILGKTQITARYINEKGELLGERTIDRIR